MRNVFKELSLDIAADIAGGIMIALGLYNFAAVMAFPMAGVSGIALIFYQLFQLPIGALTFILNIPIALLTFRALGKGFFFRSLKSIVITSIITDVLAPIFPVFHGEKLLAAIACGVLSGIGYALIFMRDSSTGGTDFITMAVNVKNPHISIGRIVFVIDSFVILLGVVFVSRDVESLIYGFIIAYISTVIMDKLMYGIVQDKVTLIVTDIGQEMCKAINREYERGGTLIKANGGYTGNRKDVVMCASNKKQMYGIRRLAKRLDPDCFIVIMDSSDIVGEGFLEE